MHYCGYSEMQMLADATDRNKQVSHLYISLRTNNK
jgi:hypothetical protein